MSPRDFSNRSEYLEAFQDRMEGRDLDDESQQRRRTESPSLRRQWVACQPHIELLREALMSSAPGIAVIGPLHGCFLFYMANLHNEVLSSSYARTMIFGADVTPLESSFLWMGGWRPTSALVLVYSLMGVQIEDALQNIRLGKQVPTQSITSILSPRQLAIMQTLQKITQQAETKLSKKHALLQMLISDQDMLEAVMLDAASPVLNDSSRFKRATEKRLIRFRRLLVQAEDLRLHTLKDLLALLTPIQAARCGIAVYDLCFSLRELGMSSGKSRLLVASLPIRPILTRPPPFAMIPIDGAFVSDGSSASQQFLNPSDVVRNNLSNETGLLLPSCSINSSSSPPSHPFSPQDFAFENSTSTISTISSLEDQSVSTGNTTTPTAEITISDYEENIEEKFTSNNQLQSIHKPSLLKSVMARDNRSSRASHPSNVGIPEHDIISSKIFMLSPSTSDVSVQTCLLSAADLSKICNLQPPLPSPQFEDDDTKEYSTRELSQSRKSYGKGPAEKSCRFLELTSETPSPELSTAEAPTSESSTSKLPTSISFTPNRRHQ